ncbi:MAG: type II and III secretion system protein [Bryobacterales bacterium]|nr:type II and III secretion system protein [Bryobacterales bacterium]
MRRSITAGLCCLCALLVCLAAESPSSLAKQARKAERSGQVVKAYLLYSQAAAADPKNRSYWVRSQALRTRALRESNALPAAITQALPAPVAKEPSPVETTIVKEDEEEARRPLPPVELAASPGRRNLDFRGDAKSLFEQVAKAFGFDTVFDADYQPGAPTRLRLEDVDFRTALRALEASTTSFAVPLGPKLLMIYKDNQQKRNEAEPTMAVTLSLPAPVAVQDAQELARSVQQMLEIQKFAIDSGRRLVLIKDRVSKVRVAQAVYRQLLGHRPQIMIEIELLDVSETNELNYGFNLPNSTAAIFLGRQVRDGIGRGIRGPRIIPDVVPGFTRFILAGGGFTTMAIAIADAKAFASRSQASSTSLFRTQLRALDGQAASVHIGDKYPIITQQYLGVDKSVSPLAVPPTFQFEDLGLNIKVTPKIHDATDVSLQVEAEFKVLGNGTFNGIPVISTRKFASTVRVRDGEYAVLAGIVSQTEARSVSGVAGLASIPLLHHLFTQTTKSKTAGESLVVIKPYIINSAEPDTVASTIYTGTESRWNTLP